MGLSPTEAQVQALSRCRVDTAQSLRPNSDSLCRAAWAWEHGWESRVQQLSARVYSAAWKPQVHSPGPPDPSLQPSVDTPPESVEESAQV